MNTRLQVEHPVTECVYGLDLVELQLRVAEGGALLGLEPARTRAGHAIEVRLYAEDPARRLAAAERRAAPRSRSPARAEFASASDGLRLDAGGRPRSAVHYDAMLAKVIVGARRREEAVRRLAGALDGRRVHGLITNRDLLVRSLRHSEFRRPG